MSQVLKSMIFFFVQIIFFNVFMYAYISDNDKQGSKVLSNLLKITMNFWTLYILHIKSTLSHEYKKFHTIFELLDRKDFQSSLYFTQFCQILWDLKFIYSKNAIKFCKMFPLLLTTIHTVKSKGKISQNFVAFSEYMNFKYQTS